MSMNYDLDQLMGTYADWIAWLKEKEASLDGQLSRMRGKRGAENRQQEAITSTDDEAGLGAEASEESHGGAGAGAQGRENDAPAAAEELSEDVPPAPDEDNAAPGAPLDDEDEDWL